MRTLSFEMDIQFHFWTLNSTNHTECLVQFECQSVPKMSDIHFWPKMNVSELHFFMMTCECRQKRRSREALASAEEEEEDQEAVVAAGKGVDGCSEAWRKRKGAVMCSQRELKRNAKKYT